MLGLTPLKVHNFSKTKPSLTVSFQFVKRAVDLHKLTAQLDNFSFLVNVIAFKEPLRLQVFADLPAAKMPIIMSTTSVCAFRIIARTTKDSA